MMSVLASGGSSGSMWQYVLLLAKLENVREEERERGEGRFDNFIFVFIFQFGVFYETPGGRASSHSLTGGLLLTHSGGTV